MINLVEFVVIKAPRDRVFALYADYRGWPRLFGATIRGARLLQEQGNSKTIQVDHREGKGTNIMVLYPPREIRLTEFKRRYDAHFLNRFDRDPGGTRYSVVAHVNIKPPFSLLGRLLVPLVRSRIRRFILEPMKRAAEPSAAGHWVGTPSHGCRA